MLSLETGIVHPLSLKNVPAEELELRLMSVLAETLDRLPKKSSEVMVIALEHCPAVRLSGALANTIWLAGPGITVKPFAAVFWIIE
jgi:hypothetical protein